MTFDQYVYEDNAICCWYLYLWASVRNDWLFYLSRKGFHLEVISNTEEGRNRSTQTNPWCPALWTGVPYTQVFLEMRSQPRASFCSVNEPVLPDAPPVKYLLAVKFKTKPSAVNLPFLKKDMRSHKSNRIIHMVFGELFPYSSPSQPERSKVFFWFKCADVRFYHCLHGSEGWQA